MSRDGEKQDRQVKGLEDLLRPGLTGVFCGLNPGLRAAATGFHFEGRGNRFWPVMHLAGFTDRLLTPPECHQLLDYGFGLATVVSRPTASADELSAHDYVTSAASLIARLERYRPAYIAFLGKAAYTAIAGRRTIEWGPQDARLGRSKVWILPNPSGRNLGFSQDALVDTYRAFRQATEAAAI